MSDSKASKPQFCLQALPDEKRAHPEPVEVYQWAGSAHEPTASRRGFIGGGLRAAAALSLLKLGQQTMSATSSFMFHSGVRAHASTVNSLVVSPDGTLLVTGASSYSTIKVWSLPERKLLRTLGDRCDNAKALAITPDGKLLISCSSASTIRVWTLATGDLKLTLSGHTDAVNAVAISPNGAFLASASSDQTVKLWSLPEGSLLQTLTGHSRGVSALAFSRDGATLVSLDFSAEVRFWAVPSGSLIKVNGSASIVGSSNLSISSLASAFDNRFLLLGQSDGAIKLMSGQEARLVQTLAGHRGRVNGLAVSPDGAYLASASEDSTVKLWSFPGAATLEATSATDATGHAMVKLSWECDCSLEEAPAVEGPWTEALNQRNPQSRAASGGSRFFRVKHDDGKQLQTLPGHPAAVTALTFTPDGTKLITGDAKGVIVIRDLQSGELESYFFDPAASETSVKAVTYQMRDSVTGAMHTRTMPCELPMPLNATSIGDCVQGTYTGSGCGGCGCFIIIRIIIPSDRAIKSNFSNVDRQAILERLAQLPIQSWNYNVEPPSTRHLGPMAQDFAAAFGLGESDRVIEAVDAHGVAFAAIQALHKLALANLEQMKRGQSRVADLEQEIRSLQEQNRLIVAQLTSLQRLD